MYSNGGVGFQLSMYRLLDALDQARDRQAAARDLTAYDALVVRHDALSRAVQEAAPMVDEIGSLVARQDREIAAKDARIAELERKLHAARSQTVGLHERIMMLVECNARLARQVQEERTARSQPGSAG